jgi:diguanylate cyclase
MAFLDAQVEGLTRRVAEQTLLLQNASLREVNVDLSQQARTDALTGCLNRRALAQAYAGLHAQARPPVVLMMELDRFKAINDGHSHAVGDAVLGRVAALMGEALREVDFLGRYGGEEFLALLCDVDIQGALAVADRLLQHVADHDWGALAPGIQVTFSGGLVPALRREPFEEAVARADTLLYRAKRAGRNRVVAEGDAP